MLVFVLVFFWCVCLCNSALNDDSFLGSRIGQWCQESALEGLPPTICHSWNLLCQKLSENEYATVKSLTYRAKTISRILRRSWNLHAKNFHKMNIPQLKLAGPKTFHENEGGRFGKYWEVSHSWKLPRQKLLTKMKPQMDECMATLNFAIFIHKYGLHFEVSNRLRHHI